MSILYSDNDVHYLLILMIKLSHNNRFTISLLTN